MQLTPGQRLPLSAAQVDLSVTLDHPDVDFSVFTLSADRRVTDDAYLTFFNQPRSPNGEVTLIQRPGGADFSVNLAALPAWAARVVLVVTSDSRPIGERRSGSVTVRSADQTLALEVPGGGTERALMLLELYLHQGQWRLAAVCQGFDGGLGALITYFGGEVAEESVPAPAPAPVPAPAPLPERSAPLSKIDLRKKLVTVQLEKSGLSGVIARVMVVMDASGSMDGYYRSGVVQRTLERFIPVASRLDDNGAMEFWYYASRFKRMGDLDEDSVEGIAAQMPQTIKALGAKIGWGNNEIPIMDDVLAVHRDAQRHDGTLTPTLVLFVTDGGIMPHVSRQIAERLKQSATEALFWQFVGLGSADYGVLQSLDTVTGRWIDNSGFFAVDDIDSLSDKKLYERLLSQFGPWWTLYQQQRVQQQLPAVGPAAEPNAGSTAGRVELSKGRRAALSKSGQITMELEWSGAGDLDLYVFYVLKNGQSGKVYYRNLGSRDEMPFITLSGDSRVPGKETAVIWQPQALSHAVFAVYSAVENGAGSFATYLPKVTFTDVTGAQVVTAVQGRNHFSYWVALSAVDCTGGGVQITHLERYSRLGTERSPQLNANGSLEMNKGPVEFKTR